MAKGRRKPGGQCTISCTTSIRNICILLLRKTSWHRRKTVWHVNETVWATGRGFGMLTAGFFLSQDGVSIDSIFCLSWRSFWHVDWTALKSRNYPLACWWSFLHVDETHPTNLRGNGETGNTLLINKTNALQTRLSPQCPTKKTRKTRTKITARKWNLWNLSAMERQLQYR